MDEHHSLKERLLTIVDRILEAGDPDIVSETFERLRDEGFSADNARTLIAQCIALEYFDGGEDVTGFDLVRLERNLSKLPRPPYEEEGDAAYDDGDEAGYDEFDDF